MAATQGAVHFQNWATEVADNMKLLPKTAPPDRTVYCYKTLAAPVCYDAPQAGQESRLIAYHTAQPRKKDTSLFSMIFGQPEPEATPVTSHSVAPPVTVATEAPAPMPVTQTGYFAAPATIPASNPSYLPPVPVKAATATPLPPTHLKPTPAPAHMSEEAFDVMFEKELEKDIASDEPPASASETPGPPLALRNVDK